MKYIVLALLFSTAACVTEGPPYDNVRNQRAQESLRDANDNGNHDDYQHGHDLVAQHND